VEERRMRLVGWVLWVLFYSCLFHSVDSKVISEFLDTLTGTWKLQWTLSDTREQLLWNSHSCCSHCVRHLYWTPSLGEEFTLQGSYLEFDQERVVNNSISLVLVGFAQNDTVKISLQDSRYSDDNHLVSFRITKDDERKVFYMMQQSTHPLDNTSISMCFGTLLERDLLFVSCGGSPWLTMFGERVAEQEEKDEGLFKFLPSVMIVVVFIVVRKLQSFLLSKRATLVPTSWGGSR
jgi:hypothetical protein